MTNRDIADQYASRYPHLTDIALQLSNYIQETVSGLPHIDRIAVRAKSPERFLGKAQKISGGIQKYTDPINEIQDQIGGRITVFYLADVQRAKELILKFFVPIEIQSKEPSRNSEFGYFGEHFILKIPDDILPDQEFKDDLPEFFELQIKTLFQHAWSEADHDLAYKSVRDLKDTEQRKLAFSAAQAWGADQIFEELASSLGLGDPVSTTV
jgi:putative GTP pyrophosphokinase